MLAQWNDVSRRTLVRQFAPFFIRPLTPEEVSVVLPPRCTTSHKPWVYGADGKWLHHDGVFLNHRDVSNRENIWWSYAFKESYSAWIQDIAAFVSRLDSSQFPIGVVSDWGRGLIQAVTQIFGDIAHQRCLAHVARHALTLLPKHSPFLATRRLRDIAKAIRRIKTVEDMQEWTQSLTRWGYLYGDMLTEKTTAPLGSAHRWWYTHGNLRRGWRLLTTNTNSFFVFLAHRGIPKTNNSLEGVNRNIKGKLGIHRGLTTPFQVSLLCWVMIFSRVKKPADLRKLWAAWRRRS